MTSIGLLNRRRAAIHELLDDFRRRESIMEAIIKQSKPDLISNTLVGLAGWNAQALVVLLQIELDRLAQLPEADYGEQSDD